MRHTKLAHLILSPLPSPHRALHPHPVSPHSQVVDLKAEVSRLKGQLEDTETSCAKAVAAVEAQRDAAVGRQEDLSEDLRRARQAAERFTVSEEDAVIAVEKDMRAKHERDVAALRERASKAEERVRRWLLVPLDPFFGRRAGLGWAGLGWAGWGTVPPRGIKILFTYPCSPNASS